MGIKFSSQNDPEEPMDGLRIDWEFDFDYYADTEFVGHDLWYPGEWDSINNFTILND